MVNKKSFGRCLLLAAIAGVGVHLTNNCAIKLGIRVMAVHARASVVVAELGILYWNAHVYLLGIRLNPKVLSSKWHGNMMKEGSNRSLEEWWGQHGNELKIIWL